MLFLIWLTLASALAVISYSVFWSSSSAASWVTAARLSTSKAPSRRACSSIAFLSAPVGTSSAIIELLILLLRFLLILSHVNRDSSTRDAALDPPVDTGNGTSRCRWSSELPGARDGSTVRSAPLFVLAIPLTVRSAVIVCTLLILAVQVSMTVMSRSTPA